MSITKASLIDLNGQELILDADADTSITADTDDQIDIKIAGSDDFNITANSFNILSGSNASFADSSNAIFGAGSDLQIFHDGNNSKISNTTGGLYLGSDTLGLQSGNHGTNYLTITSGNIVLNEDGNDFDFRVEGDSQANLFVVNAGTDDIGIGIADPTFASGNGMHFADNFKAGFGTGNGTRPDFQISGDNNGLAIACGTGADTADVLIDTSGNLTVGTSSASNQLLDLKGSNTGTNAAANGHMANEVRLFNLSATDNNLSGIGFYNSNSLIDARIAGVHKSHSSRHGEIAFLTHDGSALSERWRITKDGHFKAATDGLGINFDASEGSGATSTVLDDYEEGTFTGSGTAGSSTALTIDNEKYTKIGNQVTIVFTVNFSGASGGLSVTGLPYAAAEASVGIGREDATSGYAVYGRVGQSSSGISIYYAGATANASPFQVSAGNMRFSMTYLTT